jgi:hypothetical protein
MEKKFGKQYRRVDEEDILKNQRLVYKTMKETLGLGDVEDYSEARRYLYRIQIKGKSIDHKSVKGDNLQILFELLECHK